MSRPSQRNALLFKRVAKEQIVARPFPVRDRVGKWNQRTLLVNNMRCKLLLGLTPSKIKGRLYYRFQPTSLEGVDFLILQARKVEPRFFVIPVAKLRRGVCIYIPIDFKWSSYHNARVNIKINWLRFMEAWHLLKPSVSDPIATP